MHRNLRLAFHLVALLGCGCNGSDTAEPSGVAGGEPDVGAQPRSLQGDPDAIDALEHLRDIHVWNARAGRAETPVLSPNPTRLQRVGRSFGPLLDSVSGAADYEVRAPALASAALSIIEKRSGLGFEAVLHGARAVEGRVAEGYVTYPAGGPHASTLLHRVTADGVEDYLSIAERPAAGEVSYTVTFTDAVSGLRLVSNTLELVDATGAPRLRIAPPYLVGADGLETAAELAVSGCNVDRERAAPWGRSPVAPGAKRCQVHVRWDVGAVQYPALLDPAWTSTANLATARTWATSSVLSNGKVLVAGGSSGSDGSGALAGAELYDPATRTWAATGNLSAARTFHTATTLQNGRVLITGGSANSADASALASAELYDAATGSFGDAASMLSARTHASATLLPTGDVLLAGGTNASGVLSSAEVYKASPNKWVATGNMLSPQSGHVAILLPSNALVLVLGINAPAAQLYRYTNGTWASSGSPAVPRLAGTVTVLANSQVLYAGGTLVDGSSVPWSDVYNPVLKTWARVGSLTVARAYHRTERLADGRVLVSGGKSPSGPTAGTELFDPTWGTWAPMPALASGRYGHVAARVANDRLLVAGGTGADSSAAGTAEEFSATFTAARMDEYKLPAAVDPDVLDDRETELWASVHRPATLEAGRRYPVIVFLHGMHSTCGTGSSPRVDDNCQYTDFGSCPSGYQVVASHLGLRYLADELATRGYLVVSVNSNRGINCGETLPDDLLLDLARGRLVLKHLQRLSEWDRGAAPTPSSLGVSLEGHLDLNQVGLLGHSRGGEGMRAAYQLYRDAGSVWPAADRIGPMTVRALFEIAPIDGGTPRVLNADDLAWTTLLPMCDMDVGNLDGINVFNRMQSAAFMEQNPTPKATYTVWGANHNYYNTEWQRSDSTGCYNHRALFAATGAFGSAEQRQTAFYSVVSFFTGNLGQNLDASASKLFDPAASGAAIADPRVDRGYSPARHETYNKALEDFDGPEGFNKSGQPNVASNITIRYGSVNGNPQVTGATLSWTAAGPSTFFESHWSADGQGVDLSQYEYLDLRVARTPFLNSPPPTDFAISLVNPDGSLSSSVNLSTFVKLDGPVGSATIKNTPRYHPILQTARIPLAAFSSVSRSAVRGVRLQFSISPTGYIAVTNIRASRNTGTALAAVATDAPDAAFNVVNATPTTRAAFTALAPIPEAVPQDDMGAVAAERTIISAGNRVLGIQRSGDGQLIEIQLRSDTVFQPRDTGLALVIGTSKLTRSSHPQGDLHRIVFKLSRSQWDSLSDHGALTVQYGRDVQTVWDFGTLEKTRLNQ